MDIKQRWYQKFPPSAAAITLRSILHEGGISEPIWLEYYIAGFSVDMYFPKRHKIIEVDGPYHTEQDAQEWDEYRDAMIYATEGARTLRVSLEEIEACRHGREGADDAKAQLVNKVLKFIEGGDGSPN